MLGRQWEKIIIFFIVVIMVGAGIYSIVGQKKTDDKLQVYTKSEHVESEKKNEEKKKNIKTETYVDKSYGFTAEIPQGWKKITKSGYTTFVHQESGSSVQFQTGEYDPSVNNMDEDTASDTVAKAGHTFVSFAREDSWNSEYRLLYQTKSDSIYDYTDDVHWNRNHIVTVECIYNDQYREKIGTYFDKILESFKWSSSEETIPEDYKLFYIDSGYFEFAAPLKWTISADSGSISAVNSDQTATESVNMKQMTDHLKNIQDTDLISYVKQNKSSFILKSCDRKGNDEAVVKYSYLNGETQMQSIMYIHTNGYAMYFLTFDYIEGSFDTSIADKCNSLFREFFSDKTNAEKKQILAQNQQSQSSQSSQYQQEESDNYS